MELKTLVRKGLSHLHIDLTRNMQYDRLTWRIMELTIEPDSNCIDIGCHKGEVLSRMVKLAPQGYHYAFEPIPAYFDRLKERFNGRVSVLPFALSENPGKAGFQYVKNAPAYSGLKARKYNVKNPEIEEIEVEIMRLDDIIPETLAIHFIKIDVEGGEFDVLKGARRIIKNHKPVIVFESGLGASEYYGVEPEELFSFLHKEMQCKVSLLKNFIEKKPALTRQEFLDVYQSAKEYYFVAHA
ncbi:MAG: FkbM family methyltransferase [Bacteroidales bacterium]|nr:FkbM family methyltransferase [Bacteroidales bacterium]